MDVHVFQIAEKLNLFDNLIFTLKDLFHLYRLFGRDFYHNATD